MARATVEVNRAGGELAQRIRSVRQETSGLLEELRSVDQHVTSALRSLMGFERQIRQGADLSREKVDDYQHLVRYVQGEGLRRIREAAEQRGDQAAPVQRMADTVQRYVSDLPPPPEPAAPSGPSAPPLPRSPQAPPREPARQRPRPADSGDLRGELERIQEEIAQAESDIERASRGRPPEYAQKLREADEYLQERVERRREIEDALAERARGPAMAPSERRGPERGEGVRLPRGGVEAADDQGVRHTPDPDDADPRRDAQETRQAADETTRAVEDTTRAYDGQARAQRLAGLTSKELSEEWKDNARTVRELERDLESAQKRFRRYERYQDRGIQLTRREEVDFQELPKHIQDVRGGIAAAHGERRDIQAEVERRGGQVEQGQARLPIARGTRGYLGALLGGAGIGSGSPGGIVSGAAMGALPLGLAGVTLAGMAIGKAWQYANEAADKYEQTQRRIFEAGRTLGGGFDEIRREMMSGLRSPLRLQPDETLGALTTVARATGRTDMTRSVAALARTYGLTVQEAATLVADVGALGVLPGPAEKPDPVPEAPVFRPARNVAVPETPPVEPATSVAATARPEDLGVADQKITRDTPTGLAGAIVSARVRRGIRQMMDAAGDVPWVDLFAGYTSKPEYHYSTEGSWYDSLMSGAYDFLGVEQSRAEDGPSSWVDTLRGIHGFVNGRPSRRESEPPNEPQPTVPPPPVARRSLLPEILARAYDTSAYGDDKTRTQAFFQQSRQLYQVQAAGGAPIFDFERVPGMLAEASRLYGDDVHPRFPAGTVKAAMQSVQEAPKEAARGLQVREIMRRAAQMTPEELAEFRRATEQMAPGGGIDPTTYLGARAALQNVMGLPGVQESGFNPQRLVLDASVGALERITGRGTEMQGISFLDYTGGNAAAALVLQRRREELLQARAEGRPTAEIEAEFARLTDTPEAKPFVLDARALEKELGVGGPLKQMGQSIRESIHDFIDDLRGAQDDWESSGLSAR